MQTDEGENTHFLYTGYIVDLKLFTEVFLGVYITRVKMYTFIFGYVI